MTTHGVVLPLFAPAQTKRYRTLVADPPWHYDVRRTDETHRARSPYPTMTQAELLQLPVGRWAAEEAHCYLWATNAFLQQAFALLAAWGFAYKTLLTWGKGRIEGGRLIHQIGVGNYYRNSTEHILFGVRGGLPVLNHDAATLFITPRREHSQKPDAFYDRVQHMSPGPYLDVFSRQQRLGWDTWGAECFNFGTQEPAETFVGRPAPDHAQEGASL